MTELFSVLMSVWTTVRLFWTCDDRSAARATRGVAEAKANRGRRVTANCIVSELRVLEGVKFGEGAGRREVGAGVE